MTGRPVQQRRVIIEGRVQGVGFRFFARDRAVALGLRGRVRNLPDGQRVEAVVQGEHEAMNRFIAEMHRGPAGAFVSSVVVTEQDVAGDFDGFQISR
jgi:acylphosphatase